MFQLCGDIPNIQRLSKICDCLGYDFATISWIYRVFFMPSNPFGYMFEGPHVVNPLDYMHTNPS